MLATTLATAAKCISLRRLTDADGALAYTVRNDGSQPSEWCREPPVML